MRKAEAETPAPVSLMNDVFRPSRPSALDNLFGNANQQSRKRSYDQITPTENGTNLAAEKPSVQINAAKDDAPAAKKSRFSDIGLDPSQVRIFEDLMGMRDVTMREPLKFQNNKH